MRISLIVAMDEKGGIGWQGRLPWRLSGDQKLFKSVTLGHHLIMGRKTFDSIGRPLPGRTTIIVTRNRYLTVKHEGSDPIFVTHSLREALDLARVRGEDEVFVIGGAAVYLEALPMADRLYLTMVHTDHSPADVFLPLIQEQDWIEQETFYFSADEKNEFPFTYRVLDKKRQEQF